LRRKKEKKRKEKGKKGRKKEKGRRGKKGGEPNRNSERKIQIIFKKIKLHFFTMLSKIDMKLRSDLENPKFTIKKIGGVIN
jgi:hypothetical protein